jgi:DNA-binding CsgD family transcriptional regulator
MIDHIESVIATGVDDLMAASAALNFGQMLLSVEPPIWRTQQSQVIPFCVASAGFALDSVKLYLSNIKADPLRGRDVRMMISDTTLPIVWYVREEKVSIDIGMTYCPREICRMKAATTSDIRTGISTQILTEFGTSVFLNFYSKLPRATAIPTPDVVSQIFYISHEVQHRLSGMSRRRNHDSVKLSRREIQCLEWSAQGKSSTEIAIILGLADGTVREYFKSAATKLNATNRAQAVARSIGLGLLR